MRILTAFLAIFPLIAVPAYAAVVDTPAIVAGTEKAPPASLTKRQAIEQRLIELGVKPSESARRVQQMTDAEITQLYARLDELPVGQGVSTTHLLLIIIILILLL